MRLDRSQLAACYEVDISSEVERERMRSQRFRVPTCLVEFDASQTRRPHRTVRVLLKGLARRVRAVDKIGRTNDDRVVLILPSTEVAGADKVLHDVLSSIRTEEPLPYTVCRYPEGNVGVPTAVRREVESPRRTNRVLQPTA